MEQHRTRPPQQGPRRGTSPPLPPQTARGVVRTPRPPRSAVRPTRPGPQRGTTPRGTAPERRPAPARRPPPAAAVPARPLPKPRLTGLGCGLFCGTLMLTLGFLDQLLFGASPLVYGVLFLPVCVLGAVWVRRGDLVTVPVVVPIAFAVGLLPLAHGDGPGSRIMALFTALATQAGWLYGGTLIAGAIVTVRKLRLMAKRAAAARRRPPTAA
ncbi:DUF6542 domain-containing protein [Streptomyces sp. enrichment culture]|uniref:DUF6542 domain-containing protein n=1 Tax=Streptomyces sp. enrichment culture TaxID=1795815 RepID=UPI003F55F720